MSIKLKSIFAIGAVVVFGILTYVIASPQQLSHGHRNRLVSDSGLLMPDDYARLTTRNANRSRALVKKKDGDSVGVARDPNGQLKIVYPSTMPNSNSQYQNPQDQVQTRFRPNNQDVRNPTRESDIIFPTDDDTTINLQNRNSDMVPPKPKCRRGETFCENVEYYPDDHITKVLEEEGHKYNGLFGDDVVVPAEPSLNLTQRIDLPGEMSLCDSHETVVYPKVGLNSDEKWRYIVNSRNYTQGIRIEQCRNEKSQCFMGDIYPNGYTAECQQKYILRHLVSLNEFGKTVKELYKIPSCCKCILKFEPSGK